jgi:serine/threonine-protein kinase
VDSTLAGRYRLLEPLGSGGMSVVWRGYDEVLGRRVAVKVLAAEFAGDAEFRSRIRREAQAVARLSDPHITNVYDYGEAPDGTPFVVMELIEGMSLADRLRRGPLPWESVARIGAQVAGALAAAHAHGLVHQDIKPANVMLSASGVKVVDFGISAIAGEHGGPVLGTPGYLAPEQRAGAPAEPATDMFALGLLMSRALPGGVAVPTALTDVIAGCLSPDAAGRPSSASVAARLAGVLAGAPVVPPPARQSSSGQAPPADPHPPTRVLRPAPVGRQGTRILPPPPPPPPVRRRRRRWPVVAVAAVLILLACFAGGKRLAGRHGGPAATGSARPAAVDPAAPATGRRRPSPSPSPSPAAGCRVDYRLTDYGIGFRADLTLTNSGAADISRWTLVFDLPDGQKLGLGWGGVWKQDGGRITVSDVLLNGTVKPGKSIDIGFVGTYHGGGDKPHAFSLNGTACDQAGV